ncbi:MAG TPA: hypothetical protein VHI54_02565 [Actinomycetota bacterium]|nr:hypothetical protein [Actinomycetota bacterium]
MLGWLLFALLGIIWIAFLLPRKHSSPLGSAKDFERTLNLLAEANRTVSGRWVLVPPKGRVLDGGQTSRRIRARRRRRLLFVLMADGALMTGIMGAFPGLRPMLFGTAFLSSLLLLYTGLLAAIAAHERAETRRRRARALLEQRPRVMSRYTAVPNRNGNGQPALEGNGHPGGNGKGHRSGNGNGHWTIAVSDGRKMAATAFEDSDDDVHVVVRRAPARSRGAMRSAG